MAGTIVTCNGCCGSGEIVVLEAPELIPAVLEDDGPAPAADPPPDSAPEPVLGIAAPPLARDVGL